MTTGIIPVRFAVFEAGRKGYATGWRSPLASKPPWARLDYHFTEKV
jgi:hypothetical protein